jgi:hypothetical protein
MTTAQTPRRQDGATPIDGKMAAALRRSSETMERELSHAIIKYTLDTVRDVAGTYLLPHSRCPIFNLIKFNDLGYLLNKKK